MPEEWKKQSLLVTGANGGIARITCQLLAEKDLGRIALACRSHSSAVQVREDLIRALPAANHTQLEPYGGFDMYSLEKIRASVDTLPQDKPFDMVFLSVGGPVFSKSFQVVPWGKYEVEENVCKNTLGSHATLLALKNRGLLKKGCRVVFAGGEMSRGYKYVAAQPQFSQPQELREYILQTRQLAQPYKAMDAYAIGKFTGVLWLQKAASVLDGEASLISMSPGFTYGTHINDRMPALQRWLLTNVYIRFMRWRGQSAGPQEGAVKFADCLKGTVGTHGQVLGAPAGRTLGPLSDQLPMNPYFTKGPLIEEFWRILEDLCGPWHGEASQKP
ncbi:Rossmann-fold NAD(P)-binding domain-containing protein [Flexibacterium corallicola]|uniref:hypothetical protein n=1 Tax=Flexibacterium corallicola TaxID=3037259 RepID=UPI00286F0505|nr:hypothetical protein [Pseudovibrio sp. M1P-2-3]